MKRIQAELKDLIEKAGENPGFTVEPDKNNGLKWDVTLIGPPGSLYEGGKFKVSVNFPDNYPFKMPTFKFETRIWHPNVYDEAPNVGEICKDMLQDKEWVPTRKVRSVVEILMNVLNSPNQESVVNNAAGEQFAKDPEGFKKQVAEYIQRYAQ